MTIRRTLAAIVVGLVVLTGCSSTGGAARERAAAESAGGCAHPTRTITVVTHGVQGDPFWDVVKKGAEDAGKRYCANVTYQGFGDPQAQSQAIDNAVAQGVDGVVVSMANPDGVRDSVQGAVKKGIRVITVNSGERDSKRFGALVHIGQNEAAAGAAAGAEFKKAGDKKVLCVIHEAGNIAQEARCRGAEKAFGTPMVRLQVNIANLGEASSTIQTALAADRSIDGILTLNSAVATAASPAIDASGRKITLGTFDLDKDVAGLIQSGKVTFALDQQPYLQGYLAVESLVLNAEGGFVIGGGQAIPTGPSVVNSSNIKAALDGIAKGVR